MTPPCHKRGYLLLPSKETMVAVREGVIRTGRFSAEEDEDVVHHQA